MVIIIIIIIINIIIIIIIILSLIINRLPLHVEVTFKCFLKVKLCLFRLVLKKVLLLVDTNEILSEAKTNKILSNTATNVKYVIVFFLGSGIRWE